MGEILGNRSHRRVTDELADLLEGRCEGRVMYFGSCATLAVHGQSLNRFLRRTGALAVVGYRDDIDVMESMALEVLLLGTLQYHPLTRAGLREWEAELRDRARGLAKHLGLRVHVRRG